MTGQEVPITGRLSLPASGGSGDLPATGPTLPAREPPGAIRSLLLGITYRVFLSHDSVPTLSAHRNAMNFLSFLLACRLPTPFAPRAEHIDVASHSFSKRRYGHGGRRLGPRGRQCRTAQCPSGPPEGQLFSAAPRGLARSGGAHCRHVQRDRDADPAPRL